ncbi:hypothetical protein [uncultured Cocleimonas sp.]|uniref:hypothetical protein n=1 Tax=uncultured Cocleimonas sp. TaxID=1051587 RepID=UPI00261670CB|nr:hypothetical protein [uncultured Cocleimonas sp.]
MSNNQLPYQKDSVSIEEKVRFLQRVDSYPHENDHIEVIETHMSWIFMGEEYVYKLKKPVAFDRMNFSTVDDRYINCEREVRLNRRMAEEIYLGIIPLTLSENKQIALNGEGPTIDWLVKMRRLPLDLMLDMAILNDTVSNTDVSRFSQVLINFYLHIATPIQIDPDTYLNRFKQRIANIHTKLCNPDYQMSLSQIKRLSDAQMQFLETQGDLLKSRAKENHIVEAHGDLRPEHICLTQKPIIIDCLEFDLDLRTQDPVDELSYLAMECERLGAPLIGEQVLRLYFEATSDQPPEPLISFYKVFRAYIRSRIALRHIDDDQPNNHQKWRAQANQYLTIAERYIP